MSSRENRIIRIAEGASAEDATLQFMMNCLLYSRIETGHESNAEEYDEDVNVYLAHLLNSFINPRYYRAARKYITDYDTDVFARLEKSGDTRMKYTLYKTNADYLLLSMSIFSSGAPESPRPRPMFRNGRKGKIHRGKIYYQFAFSYSQRITPRSSMITEVLAKLSSGFEKYLEILSHLRGEYFNLHDRLTDGEEYHLLRSMDETEEIEDIRRTQDEFLDLYREWKDRPGDRELQKLQEVCARLRVLDPTFKFEPSP
jgi:hypothetical protein